MEAVILHTYIFKYQLQKKNRQHLGGGKLQQIPRRKLFQLKKGGVVEYRVFHFFLII